jgi:hypothetical protein
MGQKWQGMIKILENTGEQFDILLGKFGTKPSEGGIMDWVTTLSAGLGQIVFFLNYVADSIGRLSQGKFAEQLTAALNYGRAYEEFVRQQNIGLNTVSNSGMTPIIMGGPPASVTINVNNGNVTAQEIADKINRANRTTGTNIIR